MLTRAVLTLNRLYCSFPHTFLTLYSRFTGWSGVPALLSCAEEDDGCNGCTETSSRYPNSQEYLSRKDGGNEDGGDGSERGRVLGKKELMRVLYQVCWEELVRKTKKKKRSLSSYCY